MRGRSLTQAQQQQQQQQCLRTPHPVVHACTQALADQHLSTTQVATILREVDKDGNGEIDFNEFCILLRSQDLGA
jgi:hypothetical protein